MSELDDLQAAVSAREADVANGEAAVEGLTEEVANTPPLQRPPLIVALRRAQAKLTAARAALAAAQAALEAFLDAPFIALPQDVPVALLPVRIETRFVTDAAGSALLVRVYPDDVAIDDHRPGLTDVELGAAAAYWERVWRAGRSDPAAERAAFADLGAQLGVTRALWVVHATQPDETARPDAPVAPTAPLPSPPVLADAPRADDADLAPAVSRVMPGRWTVLGFRGGARVARVDGEPVPDPLPVGPSGAAPPPGDETAPPLEDAVRWLADFDAAVAVGMGIRVPVADALGFDRLVVIGVRGDDPAAGAQRLEQLLDNHRYTGGLGFLDAGAATNNTDVDRSAWTRFPDAGVAFDADRAGAPATSANGGALASALGIALPAFAGVEGAVDGDSGDARAMQLALWPATLAYFLETMIGPAIDDALVEAARELFVEAVRGLGPLPALRVGRQPYGVLPVMALGPWWRAAPADSARHATLVDLLQRLAPEWLSTTRPGGPRTVPHVGRPGADPDQELLDILARDAQAGSYRLRPARGAQTAQAMTPMIGTLDAGGGAIADAALGLVGAAAVEPRLARFQWEAVTVPIRRAPVLDDALSEADPLPPDPASAVNYLQFLANRAEASGAFTGPGAQTLLYKLALHSCALADADAAVRLRRPVSVVAAKAALEPDLVDPEPAQTTDTAPRLLARPATDVLSAQLPAGQTVGQFVATATLGKLEQFGFGDIGPAVVRAAEVRKALGGLATRPTAVLDRLVRAALDACSYRLDAWLTAYATRRLADVRALHAEGVAIGGYAWVEDLRPKPPPQPVSALPTGEAGPLVSDPTNAGYVAAPSPTQAATAALLLSGHLSHRGASGPSAQAFAVDLSSDRVRLATWLLDGIRQGQPLGALLGYRFERGLHDRSGTGLELDRFIRPFRALAPLVAGRTEEVASTVEAVEAVAASNVVDGLTLLTRFQADATLVEPALADASPGERAAVLDELASLADAADALADLMTAETTYQLASGNIPRAAASLDGLGSGVGAPPEPEVVRTPRRGHATTHRLLGLVPTATAAAAGWSAGAKRPRRVAEPRLDAWVAALLGPSDQIRAAVRVDDAVHDVTVADVGACALDLVYSTPADFERLVADHAGGEVVREDEPDWPGAAWPPGTVALDDALEQGRWIAEATGGVRPLTAPDLGPPGAVTDTGIDGDELAARVAAVAKLYRDAARDLRSGAADDALRTLGGFGLHGTADAVLAEADRVIAQLDQLDGAAALQAMLGPAFLVLPVVEAPGADFAQALAAGADPAFLDGDLAAPLAWLQRVAHTRAPIDRYLLAVAGGGGPFAVAQLPSAARWAGLPLADGQAEPATGATSMLMHGAPAGSKLAGFVVDEWADVVPARDTTAAVAFQFDEPGARAPQAVLLAVPPEIGAPWSLDKLADTITQTADLARIRMVGPEEVPWFGRYLPALYVADNASGEIFTVDFHELVLNAQVSPS
ncbi:MAG TPA: hypothetical protein VKB54_08175 [Solirubrobacteraceae bacterium]|nr:hypothetical protein [Solirubrobacteraceae bacterium]